MGSRSETEEFRDFDFQCFTDPSEGEYRDIGFAGLDPGHAGFFEIALDGKFVLGQALPHPEFFDPGAQVCEEFRIRHRCITFI